MRRCGADVKVESKESIGREPFKQLPGKWSSDMVCTFILLAIDSDQFHCRDMGTRFCRCILTVGPFGALLIHM